MVILVFWREVVNEIGEIGSRKGLFEIAADRRKIT